MRILLVHEYYRERGGEDVAFETDAALLEAAGHEVRRLIFSNDSIPDHISALQRIQLFASTVWSWEAAHEVEEAIAEIRPDVVQFHNTFPLVSPAALRAATGRGVAVVATMHNYRLLCPSADFFRDGRICEDCLHLPAPLPAVLHGCYRGSRGQSAAVATMLVFHRLRRTWLKDVDMLICPSGFLRSKLIESGLPPAKVVVRTNAIAAPPPPAQPRDRDGSFLYVGRLANNKGVGTLLHTWERNADLAPLRIAGSGEMASAVRDAAENESIDYLGALPREEVFERMRSATALVFPSIWYENQPLAILEAFASGLPVIASRIGALPELVVDGETGLLFAPADTTDLASKLRWVMRNPRAVSEMGQRARSAFEQHYSPDRSIDALVGLYQTAIDRSRGQVAAGAAWNPWP